ncbi:MAG: hypothetical protein EOS76_03545 [Mesorhizobium sp.]|uniref:hypothetical protein n=1 Tax=Mesorhizobium sp. TaxID=1871066 RepID=UPI000FE7B206|nr:hypothetical protein [Mesorhizobium sp.]RWE21743.1 MAG: hypothetical protein EOS76_03545 [Mesorhizobium sp.]
MWVPTRSGGLSALHNLAGISEKKGGAILSSALVIITYLTIALCIIGQSITELYTSNYLFVLIACHTAKLCLIKFRSPLDMVIGIAFLLLYVPFAPNLLIFDGVDASVIISIFIIFSDILRVLDNTPDFIPVIHSGKWLQWCGLAVGLSSIVLVGIVAPRPEMSLMIPIGVALYFQEYLIKSGQKRPGSVIVFLLFEAAIGGNLFLYWGGYGRLAVAAYLIMPFAMLCSYHRIGIRFSYLVLAMPALLIWAMLVRGEDANSITSSAAVGVTDHMRFTEYLRTGLGYGDVGLGPYLKQLELFYLNWFPRDHWAGKPVGAGYYSVDYLWGRVGVGDDYNVSLGFVGDQLFTLGKAYPIGLLIVLTSVILTRRALVWLSGNDSIAALIAFDATLLTYFWGGMAAFGARAWFVILPILALSGLGKIWTNGSRGRPSVTEITYSRS